MVMMMRIGVPDRLQLPQAVDTGQLGEHQRHHMIPALERLVVGIAIVPRHRGRQLNPRHWFQQLCKNAIAKSHARPLSESRQPESTCFMPGKPGMHRDIVNHSPDSPARRRGPITTDVIVWRFFFPQHLSPRGGRRVWVPAFAGTTWTWV